MSALNESAEASRQLDEQRVSFENDKRILEDTIADLSTVEERAFSNQAAIQDELRAQARLAQVGYPSVHLIGHSPDVHLMQ